MEVIKLYQTPKKDSRFLATIRIELAQVFDFNKENTIVCSVLAHWTMGDHEKQKDSFNGWIALSKKELRKACFGWVCIRKIDEALVTLTELGLLETYSPSGGARSEYRLDMLALSRLVDAAPGGYDVPDPGCDKSASGKYATSELTAGMPSGPAGSGGSDGRNAVSNKEEKKFNRKEEERSLDSFSTLRVLRTRIKALRGVKWNKQVETRVLSWLDGAGSGLSVDRILSALEAFQREDFWREYADIPAAFLKFAAAFEDDAPADVTPLPPLEPPIVAPARPDRQEAPPQTAPVPVGPTPATLIAKWNELATSAPPIKVRDPELERGLASLISDKEFIDNFEEICRMVNNARSGGEAGYLTLGWLVSKGTWRRLLNGNYQFKKRGAGSSSVGDKLLQEIAARRKQREAQVGSKS